MSEWEDVAEAKRVKDWQDLVNAPEGSVLQADRDKAQRMLDSRRSQPAPSQPVTTAPGDVSAPGAQPVREGVDAAVRVPPAVQERAAENRR